MAQLLEYKCPCCGGAVNFDITLQKVKCPYCDTEFEMDALKGYDDDLKQDKTDEMSWDTGAGSEWTDSDQQGMRVYVCKSCGGEIVGDENLASTSCPFCSNPVVVMGNLAGMLKPDIVIPFKLDKNAAKAGLSKHVMGKKLLPKIFKDQNHIDEIKAMYVPFWLFDADADANVRYRATRVRTWSDRHFRYTETSFYSVNRAGTLKFADVPVDGSKRIDDDIMESIEPFDMSQAVDFQTAYLAGYLADKYDVNAEESIPRANARVKKSTEDMLASTVKGFTTVVTENSNVRLFHGKAKYALLPVWFLNTTWNGKKYTFAMNGQTGKFVGDLPLDKKALLMWRIIIFLIAAGLALGIGLLVHYFFLI